MTEKTTKANATETKQPKVLRLYGCGGAGINIVSQYVDRKPEAGCSIIAPAFLDTSASNLTSNVLGNKKVETYLIEGLDGSGKERSQNSESISKVIKNVVQTVKPGDFNIVVFSGSGGSGNVFGSLLLAELQDLGHDVIAIVIGTSESKIACQNTLRTLQTLEGIADDTGKPVNIAYLHNTDVRSKTDADVHAIIAAFSLTTSGLHHGLDTADVKNFLLHNKFSGQPPRLYTINVILKAKDVESIASPLSIMSLYNDADQARVDSSAEYITDGISDIKSKNLDELHILIHDGIAVVADDVRKMLNDKIAARESVVQRDSLLTSEVKKTGRLVL